MSLESDSVTSSTVALCEFSAVAVFVRLASCAADAFDVQPRLIMSSDNWGFFLLGFCLYLSCSACPTTSHVLHYISGQKFGPCDVKIFLMVLVA